VNKLKDTEDYLRTWLNRYRQATDIAPGVQETLEEVTWANNALCNVPPGAEGVSRDPVDRWTEFNHDHITRVLPQLPSFTSANSTGMINVSSSTASANNAVMSYVLKVGGAGTPSANSYASEHVGAYMALQEKRGRVSQVRGLLNSRWPRCIERFDAAVQAYKLQSVGTGSASNTALEMRTVLDGVQGELFVEARYKHGEKKDWSLIADRVGRDAFQKQLLLNQEEIRSDLYGQLSSIAKRRSDQQTQALDALWSMFLNHLFAVLSC
jgi:hypothetical protein